MALQREEGPRHVPLALVHPLSQAQSSRVQASAATQATAGACALWQGLLLALRTACTS